MKKFSDEILRNIFLRQRREMPHQSDVEKELQILQIQKVSSGITCFNP